MENSNKDFVSKLAFERMELQQKDNGTSSLVMNNAKSFSNCFC
jgi:hypothetical protein